MNEALIVHQYCHCVSAMRYAVRRAPIAYNKNSEAEQHQQTGTSRGQT